MHEPEEKSEPQYGRQVFERLSEALSVELRRDTAIAGRDYDIAPNYDFRDDGAWLRPSNAIDETNWSPACDAEEGPASPDPMTTPALPFPFTARHLAAFMLGFWGHALRSRFERHDGHLDEEMVQLLLGGVRDVKPREAIAGAFAALEQARQQVGAEQDLRLSRAEQAALAALEEATNEAERLHDWREVGITEQECSARVQRRNELTATADIALRNARKASKKHDVAWRRSMVRCLLPTSVDLPTPTPKQGGSAAKRWTPDRLAELETYRARHGTTKAATHFGITTTRVRALLPRGGQAKKPTAHNPFGKVAKK